MKLEAVTTCAHYGDFLAATLPLNKQHFDRLVVVTSTDDIETQKLCEYHYVECVPTDAFRLDLGEFHKGAAINEGLERLDRDDWVIHLDSDIVLPSQTRRLIEQAQLDPGMVYGIDRHNMVGAKAWDKHCMKPRLQHEADVYVHTEAYPIATRFMSPQMGGYLPIGFFQLWHPDGSGVHTYPQTHGNAGRTDMMFAAQWPRQRRGMLPEFVAYHIESEAAPQGANWDGRTTRRLDEPYGLRRILPWHWRHWRHHSRHHHPKPYEAS